MMPLRRLFSNRAIILMHDTLMVMVAWFGAYLLRFNLSFFHPAMWHIAIVVLPMVVVLQMMTALWAGCYRGVWRFASIPDLVRILKAVVIGTLVILGCVFVFNRLDNVPRAVFPLYAILLTACWSGSRIIYRMTRDRFSIAAHQQRVLIVGAGQAGEGLVRDLLRDSLQRYVPVAFLDDDEQNRGRDIHGIRVVGRLDSIEKYAAKHAVSLVMLAVPSATTQQMQTLVEACERINIPYRTLPSIADLTEDRVTINELRRVEIEDLLGRDPVDLDWDTITDHIKGKVVLVTGGGGSIGSELCRQISKQQPTQLIICENSEYNLYQITQELATNTCRVVGLLVDTSDLKFVNATLKKYRPDIVFHASACKHVPMLEDQLLAAVKNNIFATRVIADLAVQYRVKTFVLVSSDKAVNPTNVMGLSKRIAEIYCQNLNEKGDTQFITVRFGNVLGSAGSVVPLFRKQLQAGGPITVTHADITRYFMTIPEACQLILQASVMGKGGEIYVLDMGEPIKIRYLAEKMIELSGHKLNEDIEIVYTGLRPGEKLHEELFHEQEALQGTCHEKILQANARSLDWSLLVAYFDKINQACIEVNEQQLIVLMNKLVPEYHSN
ncbi:MAG: polysaccharide biosynthesis protein [Immundisolibacteraceae bacterium]|nr:polysaccharide biosynthesis protein [Immundisolibacteraceae bacterium]